MMNPRDALASLAAMSLAGAASAEPPLGYYRNPTIHEQTIVFVAEGDLWKVSSKGGVASRLTSHAGDEDSPEISPDGRWVAFTASYEGPTEVYVMPLDGGLPKRLTWDASRCGVEGWKAGRIIASTTRFSTLPSTQLTLIDPESGARELVPLAQAADGCYDDSGATLFFTRLPFQGSQTKRYKGGTVQQLWRFSDGDAEATPLTSDFAGTSTNAMWWKGRVYFLSDRDGTMDVWSMKPDGSDARQHTEHEGFDAKGADLSDGRIVYQLGADLWLYEVASGRSRAIEVRLSTDFDQTRERWVKKPFDYLTGAHLSHDGAQVALTARGQVFVAPKGQGRLVEVSRPAGARMRDGRFMPDGRVLAMSDETGEVEFWTYPADGSGPGTQLSRDGEVLRWEGVPSPDGALIAHHDKNLRLWVLEVATGVSTKIDEAVNEQFADLRWSADSQWLAYTLPVENLNRVVRIHNVRTGARADASTDRYDSFSPAWSADGEWLYFISDRNISSVVGSPWGTMAPEPFFDNRSKIYMVSLKAAMRSPFAPDDELTTAKKDEPKPEEKPAEDEPSEPKADEPAAIAEGAPAKDESKGKDEEKKGAAKPVEIELEGIAARLQEVPIGSGNYGNLMVTEKRLLWTHTGSGPGSGTDLMAAEIARKDVAAKALVKGVDLVELSGDGKWLLVRKGEGLHVIESGASAPATLDDKTAVGLSGWTFSLTPKEEWRQMFIEAWRLERDYFYDTKMHGVDWAEVRSRYLALVDRVSTRAELSDLIAQMVGELSALHIFVRGGDVRRGEDSAQPASLGAILERTDAGYVVRHVTRTDPDSPELSPPLARPGVDVKEGDTIIEVNGRPALEAPDLSMLLRNQAGKQVLLMVMPAAGVEPRRVVVTPISAAQDADLRYHEWQYTRRLMVEEGGGGTIGYVHLRAMGGDNMAEFARGFYPVFNRAGLIIDVRHNRGGNIDSWVLSRLLRKAWFYWQPRVGAPYWNMQYAFRGHVVVLCNERTASDGEAFSEGIKRLGIGTVIGTRTWGGEIWLSSSNFLVDGGIATSAEYGVYGPEGVWLIEGHGVEPDMVVENLPHATFNGEDAQLRAAIEFLKQKIEAEPVAVPPAPAHPDKSHKPAPKVEKRADPDGG